MRGAEEEHGQRFVDRHCDECDGLDYEGIGKLFREWCQRKERDEPTRSNYDVGFYLSQLITLKLHPVEIKEKKKKRHNYGDFHLHD